MDMDVLFSSSSSEDDEIDNVIFHTIAMGCEVLLDDAEREYHPGDNIKGTVVCSFVNPTDVKGVTVALIVEEITHWLKFDLGSSDGNNAKGQKCKWKTHKIVANENLLDAAVRTRSNSEEQRFPFSFLLKDVPSSFKFEKGTVRIYVKAAVVTNTSIACEGIVDINVFSPIDISGIENKWLEPWSHSAEKFFTSLWCISSDYVVMDVDMPKRAFVIGEQINITVTVSNWTKNKITKIEAMIGQTIEADGKSPQDGKSYHHEILCSVKELRPIQKQSEKKYRMTLEVPTHHVIPNFDNCVLLRNAFWIDTVAHVEDEDDEIRISTRIILGNGPSPEEASTDGEVSLEERILSRERDLPSRRKLLLPSTGPPPYSSARQRPRGFAMPIPLSQTPTELRTMPLPPEDHVEAPPTPQTVPVPVPVAASESYPPPPDGSPHTAAIPEISQMPFPQYTTPYFLPNPDSPPRAVVPVPAVSSESYPPVPGGPVEIAPMRERMHVPVPVRSLESYPPIPDSPVDIASIRERVGGESYPPVPDSPIEIPTRPERVLVPIPVTATDPYPPAARSNTPPPPSYKSVLYSIREDAAAALAAAEAAFSAAVNPLPSAPSAETPGFEEERSHGPYLSSPYPPQSSISPLAHVYPRRDSIRSTTSTPVSTPYFPAMINLEPNSAYPPTAGPSSSSSLIYPPEHSSCPYPDVPSDGLRSSTPPYPTKPIEGNASANVAASESLLASSVGFSVRTDTELEDQTPVPPSLSMPLPNDSAYPPPSNYFTPSSTSLTSMPQPTSSLYPPERPLMATGLPAVAPYQTDPLSRWHMIRSAVPVIGSPRQLGSAPYPVEGSVGMPIPLPVPRTSMYPPKSNLSEELPPADDSPLDVDRNKIGFSVNKDQEGSDEAALNREECES